MHNHARVREDPKDVLKPLDNLGRVGVFLRRLLLLGRRCGTQQCLGRFLIGSGLTLKA